MNKIQEISSNPYLIKAYANNKCKDCHGRGYRTVNINVGNEWVDNTVLCECVRKEIRKSG